MTMMVKYMIGKNKLVGGMSVALLCAVWITTGLFAGCGEADKDRKNIANDQEQEKQQGEPGLTIVVDAGHGGVDPGKIGVDGQLEKDINLSIALMLKEILELREDIDIEVVLTRSGDKGHYSESDSNKKMADMRARCLMVEEAGADMLISIHQNSYHSASVHGAQVFYYDESEEGKRLAESIQASLVFNLSADGKGRVAKANDNYYILLNVECPAVIVECGFLSNQEEARLLESEEYQRKVAEAIGEGVVEYLE